MHALLSSCLLIFLCLSCYQSDRWRNISIKTGNPQFNSAKLVYPATNFSHDLEVEFLYTANTLHAYINVYSQTIAPYEGDESVASLSLDVKGHHYHLLVDRLAGGQRLRIPDQSLDFFIQLLEKHSSLVLSLKEHYKTKILCKDFKKHFNTLKTKPLPFVPNDPISLAL
jgi:hypothetical protein